MNRTSAYRILVVDDEEAIRLFCQKTLTGREIAVRTAKDASQAVQWIREETFDLVLTDLTMPGRCGGADLLEDIKRRSPGTDVIIMTAYPTLDTAIPTLKHGACDYISKPFEPALLRSVVRGCLERRHLNKELTQEKKLREDLEAAYAQLKEMEQLKEAFLARVNHEFRIPLAPAMLAIDLLSHSVKDPESETLCRTVHQNLVQLHEKVESVLLFSRVRRPNFQCAKSPVPLHPLLNRVIERFRPAWEDRDITVDIDVHPEAAVCFGDPALMETIFNQLVLNAIQFNHKGGRILIKSRKRGGHIEILFIDTGIGIPQDQLPRVFDSFYQVADYLTREVGGIGLGLALVRRLAEVHGGSVSVQSHVERGSQFTVRLPDGVEAEQLREAIGL